ncbi:uroporphyrinogen-III synthase [Jonesia quinghaiensis]|uniref:uroporphyrinogen-III synthase n=1 Tax=Jonesia quinghaiensis TaxID=262806 RepID=UPI0004093FE9|nr:uroporphyrinogen-III synthase [Jonesia quinghaiensis]
MADSLVLAGCHALILRPVDRAQPLVDLIVGAGGRAVTAPLITRESISVEQRGALDAHTASLAGFAWVAVTSVNAVTELVDSITRTHPGRSVAEVARGTRWASVGRATTRALAERGIEVAFEAKENSATGMLNEWPATQPPTSSSADAPRVLLPVGNLATTQLEDGLTALGYEPIRVTAYLTVPHQAPAGVVDTWHGGGVNAVILTSGSIVDQFAHQFTYPPAAAMHQPPTATPSGVAGSEQRATGIGNHHLPLIVAIGEPTRRAATRHGIPVHAVAARASNAGLFDALVSAWTTRDTTPPEGTP